MYCEYIPTLPKSHLNSKSAMDFFLKSLQEMKQKLFRYFFRFVAIGLENEAHKI